MSGGRGRIWCLHLHQMAIRRPVHAFEPLVHSTDLRVDQSKDGSRCLGQHSCDLRQSFLKGQMVLLDLPMRTSEFVCWVLRAEKRSAIAISRIQAGQQRFARTLVASGFGFSILNIRPPDYVEDRLRYRAVPIAGMDRGQSFGIATLANTRPPKIVQAFIDSCEALQKEGVFEPLTVWEDAGAKTT